jgi:hypothetical protein
MADLLPRSALDISHEEEQELRVDLINETETLLELTKTKIAAKKAQVMVELDDRKLDAALRLMTGMEEIASIMTDPEVLGRVRDNVKSGMDMKMLADAFKNISGELKTLSRPDILDGQGTKKELNLGIQWGDAKIAVQLKE